MMRRLFSIRLLLVIALLAGLLGAGYVRLDHWQRERIFEPRNTCSWCREPPAGTEVYDLALKNGDKVRAWYWQAPRADAPTVLYLHGRLWNLNGSAFRLEVWEHMGYSVLAIDYRGFGASTGRLPSERSVMRDANAALAELARRQPNPAKRFVYGHSLGGAIAIELATQPRHPPFAGLIIESAFTSVAAMMAHTFTWGRLPGASLLVTQPFDSVDALANLRMPVLFMHGTADQVVPNTMSDALYAAAIHAPPGLKRLVKIPGASHSGAVRSGAPYENAVRAFIHDVSVRGGAS